VQEKNHANDQIVGEISAKSGILAKRRCKIGHIPAK